LGKTSSIILLFANLITSDGENQGLHGFLVPVRDAKTLKPFKNITVGDIGEKCGLNGIDNGFIMFHNYRIPKENLLNRTGDINDDGDYESVFSEPSKILGAALESLSAGRIGIMHESSNTIAQAVVIAVRYSAVRKQFGPDRNGQEISIIEYPQHQYRIFPFLAAACALKVTVTMLCDVYMTTIAKSQQESNGFEKLSQSVAEIHALISASKAMFTWVTRDAIQEAREACGGHGYLKASNLGELRNNHDATVTYEGDNNVLGQQGSNWLLKQWNGPVESPLGTVDFLARRYEILQKTSYLELKSKNENVFDFVLSCYEWLMCHLMDVTSREVEASKTRGSDSFKAKNDAQVHKARNLSLALAEFYSLRSLKTKIQSKSTPRDLEQVLTKIFTIYGFWNLDKHMATFYIGGFAIGSDFSDFVRSSLTIACDEIKDSSVAIADALSPPDFVLNSVIGKSNGKVSW
jgi:acyl-CoA oxidase